MAALRTGSALSAAVDGRSDIYSLGLLLDEALGGPDRPRPAAGPPGRDPRPGLDRYNPRVSPGLADIVARCLEPDPNDRYPDAAALALDLRRHLNDLPLRGVANRSPVERWRKWRRRHPAALARGLLRLAAAGAVVAAVAASVVQYRQRDRQIEAALREGREKLRDRRYADAVVALDRGLKLAARLPADDRRRQGLESTLRRVVRTKAADDLHELVNQLRFRFGVGTPSAGEARSLLVRGLGLWNSRDLLLAGPGAATLGAETEARVRADLLDLATIWADLRVHRAPGRGTDEALRDAVRVLREAEARFGPAPALSRDLRSYARALGQTDLPDVDVPAPSTAWEHYDLGRSYLRSGEYALAEGEFRQAVAMEPGELWPYFSQAACAYHLGHYQEAVASLTVCVALAHRTAECYYNRAVAYEALGRPDLAADDYTRALEWNPRFADAALNRGVLAFQAGRYAEAADDFGRARAAGADPTPSPASTGPNPYDAALAQLARKDLPAARASLKQAAARGDEAARRLSARLGLE
jgi:tetratricopeptide (TPR) repeat protein